MIYILEVELEFNEIQDWTSAKVTELSHYHFIKIKKKLISVKFR